MTAGLEIRRVRLEAFRCFGAPVELGPFGRLTVVHGPNGAGKSTLFAALERTFFDRPDSQAAEIDALVPWGTVLQPRVTIDLAVDGEALRVEKTFGPKGTARLYRLAGRVAEPWMEGTAAVEWLRGRFGGRQPARGVTKPEHRGLGQLFFVPQGQVTLPERLGDGAVERLRALVSEVIVDGSTRAIEDQLRKRHAELFTAGGQPKKGAPAPALKEQLRQAELALDEARLERARLDELTGELEAAARAAEALLEGRRALSEARDRLQPEVKAYRALVQRRDAARRALEDSRAAFDAVAQRIQALDDARRRLAALEGQAQEARGQLEAAETAAQARARAVDEAQAAAQAQEAGRDAVAALGRRAQLARRLTQARAEAAALAPRLADAEATRAEIDALEAALRASRGGFSGLRIKALRDALAEARSARDRLEALTLRVRITAREPVVVDGEALAPGQVRELGGDGSLRFSVGGAEVEVAGPAVDTQAARAALARSEAEAERLAAELGSRDPSELEVWRHDHKQREADLGAARARLQALLGEAGDPAKLKARLEAARAAEAEALAALSALPAHAGAADPAELEAEARDAAARFEAERAARARALEEARRVLVEAHAAREGARVRAAGLDVELRLARAQLAELEADGLSDEARAAERRRLSAARQTAEDALALAGAELARFATDPELALERAQRDLDGLGPDLERRQADRARLEQQLAGACGRAPHARLAEAEERVAVLRDALRRAELEAEAIHLLSGLFAAEHAHVTSRLVGPIVQRVVPRLRKLLPRLESVELDEALKPSAVRLQGVARAVDPAALSHGAADQLALLIRLALAELVAGAAPLPVVLDDPLVHADKGRLRRLLRLLEEAASQLQLIVLTCRPEDYGALHGAAFLDLAAPPDLFRAIT